MPFSVKYVVPKGAEANDVRAKVETVMDDLFDLTEKTFSNYSEDSEVSKINSLKQGEQHELSPSMKSLLMASKVMVKRTRGVFDPAVAPLLKYYSETAIKVRKLALEKEKRKSEGKHLDIIDHWRGLLFRGFGDSEGSLSTALERLHSISNWFSFQFSEDRNFISKKHNDALLDLNGISKGWLIDEAVRRLHEECNIQNVYVDWAGDVKVLGNHPSGRKWTVAVVEPASLEKLRERVADKACDTGEALLKLGQEEDRTENYIAVLELNDGDAVATSGDYEQVFLHKDRLYSHVVNPKKARLMELDETHLAQTVVVCKSCMYADALATAALSCETTEAARSLLDPFRTNFFSPISDFMLYAREGPRITRLVVPGLESNQQHEQRMSRHKPANVVIVGGGLAGLSAAFEAADAGATVTILEKEERTGGNSAKATSGINGWGTQTQAKLGIMDEERLFERDTFRSGKGGITNPSLVRTLSIQSATAIHWLMDKFGVPLTVLSQLGGHSAKRTHRAPPDENGRPVPIGFLIMKTLRDKIDEEYADRIKVITQARVTKLLFTTDSTGSKSVTGVEYSLQEELTQMTCDSVVIATGGFGRDRSANGLIAKYRPDLVGFPTTSGPYAVGDGIALAEGIGANLVDMDKIQLHPTGFIDPANPLNPTKFLAPEAIRGSGAILVNSNGTRFVNELELRSVVAKAILDNCSSYPDGGPPFAWVLMSPSAQELFGPAVLDFYKNRLGLFEDAETVDDIAKLIGCPSETLKDTIAKYESAFKAGVCIETDKTVFPSLISNSDSKFVLARVTPAIHYCMGGLDINAAGEVQEVIEKSVVGKHRHIRRLFAAGEVTGGVHGNNRLGGNSLLECVVFGRIAGDRAATVNQNPTPDSNLFPGTGRDGWVPCVLREMRNTDAIYGKSTRSIRFNLHGSLQRCGLKVGQYVGVRGVLDGETLQGFFSPITRPNDEGVIGILCRVDSKGGPIVKLLEYSRPGNVLQVKAMGGLALDFQDSGIFWKGRQIKRFGMICGGTGIAPMIQIIREYIHFVSRSDPKNISPMGLNLVYAAEEESDLAFMTILDGIKRDYPEHFRFYPVLNKPPLGWAEGVGFVDSHDLRRHLFHPPNETDLVVMCGPPVFETIMCRTLEKLGFESRHYFAYSQDKI